MTTPPSWLDAANALAAILQTENIALRASDFAAAAALLPAKRAAIKAVEDVTPSGSKQGLSQIVHRLEALAAENRKLLSRSIQIQSQVLDIITGAARSAATTGYGSSGKSTLRGGALTFSAKA